MTMKRKKNKKEVEQIFEKRLAFWTGIVYDNIRTNVLVCEQLFGYAAGERYKSREECCVLFCTDIVILPFLSYTEVRNSLFFP